LKALVAIQPLLDESNLGSVSFADFIVATYEMYNDSMIENDTIMALTALYRYQPSLLITVVSTRLRLEFYQNQ
jgi:hypothetical protein